MNVIQSNRTVDDVASLQQMQDVFSNQEGSLNFFKEITKCKKITIFIYLCHHHQ